MIDKACSLINKVNKQIKSIDKKEHDIDTNIGLWPQTDASYYCE